MSKTFVIDDEKSEIKHIKKDDLKKEDSVAKDEHKDSKANDQETHVIKNDDVHTSQVSSHTVQTESGLPDTGISDFMGPVSQASILIGFSLFLVLLLRKIGQSVHFIKQEG